MADNIDLSPKDLEELQQLVTTLKEMGISGEKAEQILKGFGSSLKFASKSIDALERNLKASEKEISRGNRSYKDIIPQLKNMQDALEDEIEALEASGQYEKQKPRIDKLQKQAERAESLASQEVLREAMGKAVAVGVTGLFNYAKNQVMVGLKGVLGDDSPFKVAADLQKSAIDSGLQATEGFTGIVDSLGGALSKFKNPWLQAAGGLLEMVGAIVNAGAKQAAEILKFKIDVVQGELEKTAKSFKEATAAGALFAGGMTEFRNIGLEAGLTQEQFSKSIANNSEALALMGGDVTTGAKRLTGVMKQFGEGAGSARVQLLNLGISVEDQIQGTADYMSMLQRSGNLAGKSQTDLAAESQKYMVNLKAISDFTGEDVKVAEKRAKEASMQLAVQEKLAELGPKAAEKWDAAIRTMDPSEVLAAQQKLVMGLVTDPASATFYAQNKAADELLDRTMSNIKNSGVSLDQATANYQTNLKELQPAMLEYNKSIAKSIGVNNVATGAMADVTKIASASMTLSMKDLSKSTETTVGATNNALKTQDPFTKGVNAGVDALQSLKTTIQKDLTGAITDFAEAVPDILKGFRTKLREMGLLGGEEEEKPSALSAEQQAAHKESLKKAAAISPEAVASREATNKMEEDQAQREKHRRARAEQNKKENAERLGLKYTPPKPEAEEKPAPKAETKPLSESTNAMSALADMHKKIDGTNAMLLTKQNLATPKDSFASMPKMTPTDFDALKLDPKTADQLKLALKAMDAQMITGNQITPDNQSALSKMSPADMAQLADIMSKSMADAMAPHHATQKEMATHLRDSVDVNKKILYAQQ